MIDQSQQLRNENIPMQESPDSQKAPQHTTINNPDEINLLEYVYVLVKNKWWIIGAIILGFVIGYLIANFKGPTYVADAVIAPKETENQKTPNLSAFGALSGIVAGQLNIAGNPGLDKIELILNSRKFNAEMIEKYKLLPLIYKNKWPKEYRKYFDITTQNWKSDFKKPEMLIMGNVIKTQFLKKEIKDNTMTLRVESNDSLFSYLLLSNYIEFLNVDIQSTVQADSKENVSYLENQLITISDPLLREKLQGMIASEIEKAMLVSKEAFRVVDPEIITKSFKEKKLYPIIFSFGLFLLCIFCIVLIHVLSSGEKTQEDRLFISKILSELWIRRKIG